METLRGHFEGLVTTPGSANFSGVQVLWKLPVVGMQVTGLITTPGGSRDGKSLVEAVRGLCADSTAGDNTWRKLGWLTGLVEAARGRYNT